MVAGYLLLLGALSVIAQSAPLPSAAPTPGDAALLFAKAASRTILLGQGTIPFHLSAKVKSFGHYGSATEGSFVLRWGGPDRWRIETDVGGSAGVLLFDNDHRWMSLTDKQQLLILRLGETINVPSGLRFLPGEKVTKAERRDVGGTAADCFTTEVSGVAAWGLAGAMLLHREICLDAVAGLPSLKQEDRIGRKFVYSDYVPLGLRRFPTRLRYLLNEKPLLEVEVESLDALGTPDPTLFADPAGVESWAGCSAMISPRLLHRGSSSEGIYPSGAQTGPGKGLVTSVSYMIEADGRVRNFKVLDREGYSITVDAQLHALREAIYQPATCAGRPVPVQVMTELSAAPELLGATVFYNGEPRNR